MPSVILKTNAGIDFVTPQKTISLKGFCLINEVSNEDLNLLKTKKSFKRMLDNGSAIVSAKASTDDSNKLASELTQAQLTKQANKTSKAIKKEA